MKPTIRMKVVGGFAVVLLLMAIVAVIGGYSVISLRRSANEATHVGARLNSIALEIQVHNLGAQGKVASYMALPATGGKQEEREMNIEEAKFEIHAIESLARSGMEISPTPRMRNRFEKVGAAVSDYKGALAQVVEADKRGASAADAKAAATYGDIAESLNDTAEDAELAGKDASESSLESIDRTSKRSVALVLAISCLALALGLIVSYTLARAILVPVGHLRSVAENVSMGNLDVSVRRYSNDEIGDLADSFARMVTAVKFFRLEAEEATESKLAAGGGKGGER